MSREEARGLALVAQMLAEPPSTSPSKESLRELVDRLACIQIDTIHVVARSQYIIPWSRLGHYDPAWLDELLHPDHELFEYWGHAASLIDTRLFPCFRRRMDDYRRYSESGEHDWASEHRELIRQVYARVVDEGPLMSASFERPNPDEPVEAWAWWGGKPANRALDILWSSGRLAIQRRVNFHRVYDLTERVLPDAIAEDLLEPDVERHVLASRALQALGLVMPRWLNDYFRTKWGAPSGGPPRPTEILEHLATTGEAVPVEVEGLGPAYVAAQYEPVLADLRNGYEPRVTTLLSPFDNLIWDRKRTLDLFDFDYRLECYTPAAKRVYGYFSLPILHRGKLIGRLDPKVERKDRLLYVRALHLEPRVQLDDRMIEAVCMTLREFATFNGADGVVLEDAPDRFREAMVGA
jgi:uncharacterized protein